MQRQCLSNGIDGSFTKDVLLDFTLILTATSPLSRNIFLFQSIFTCHSYFSDVQCATVLPIASRVTAKVKLFGLCSCVTALSLWQREGNKERFSSASQHCCHGITRAFKSLRWVISPKRQKHVPDCIPGSIYAHFTASWLFFSW